MLWPDKAKKYLKKYWKIENLKDKQHEAINELLLGNDVIGLLPTGYGKSMCYLIPPLVSKKVMFIISPLKSLMEDQKNKLVQMGISCAALHSDNKNRNNEIQEILNGNIKIVYMSPEYLLKMNTSDEEDVTFTGGIDLAEKLVSLGILGFIAIDEAHCCSVWGQDFRPEYKEIKIFRENFPDIPMLAVTATATEVVCNDIKKILKLNNPIIVKASFDRPNLYLKVTEIPTVPSKAKQKKLVPREQLVLPIIKKYNTDKIIIYVNSRKDTEDLSNAINKSIKDCSKPFHAGLSSKIKEDTQNEFNKGDIKVIVCTTAFGMGIDQNVKCVIVIGCPSSIEEYYQQIGRAGRDGTPSETILFFDYSKLIVGKYMMKDLKYKFPQLYKVKEANYNHISKFAYTNTCRRKYVLEYFNESTTFFSCNNCDNCCEQELVDMTEQFCNILFSKENVNIITNISTIRNKYIQPISVLDKYDKDKQVDLDLLTPLRTWYNHIITNKISKNNIPENLKIKIPRKFLIPEKKVEKNLENNFEESINKFEKMLNI